MKPRQSRHFTKFRSSFAKYIASKGYAAVDIKENAPRDRTDGEQAILTSIEAYRNFRVAELRSNMRVLRKAIRFADSEDSPDGLVIAPARLIADASFLGFGEDALEYSQSALSQLDNVISEKVRIRALDVATTVTLNTINPRDFRTLNSPALDGILDQWEKSVELHAYEANAEELFERYGIESTGILQHVWLIGMQRSRPDIDSNLRPSSSDSRDQYFNQLLNKTLDLIPAHGVEMAEDCFYSLHRLIFQAAASGDDPSQTKDLLDFYFGRTQMSLINEQLNTVRQWILRNLPGSTPWMVLLDVACADNIEEKKLRYSRLYVPDRKFPNQTLTRAIIQVGKDLKYNPDALAAKFGDFMMAQEGQKMSINQAYRLLVCDRDGNSPVLV